MKPALDMSAFVTLVAALESMMPVVEIPDQGGSSAGTDGAWLTQNAGKACKGSYFLIGLIQSCGGDNLPGRDDNLNEATTAPIRSW